jgi:MFS family permease
MIPLLKPLMGRLSDKIGRTIPIVAGSLVSAFALGMIPFALQFTLLLLISILYGMGFSMVTASTPALVSELTDKTLVGTGMGFLGTIMDLGQTLGPIITGIILGVGLGYLGSFAALTVILLITCGVFVASGAGRAVVKNV